MDFPKTIYVVEDEDTFGYWGAHENIEDTRDGIIAVYTLKEVKKKVTNVELTDL